MTEQALINVALKMGLDNMMWLAGHDVLARESLYDLYRAEIVVRFKLSVDRYVEFRIPENDIIVKGVDGVLEELKARYPEWLQNKPSNADYV